MSFTEKIYESAPVFFQNTLCSLYGLLEARKRFGQETTEYLKHLKISDWYSESAISGIKESNLSSLLLRAKKTEFYRGYLARFSPEDVFNNPKAILETLPIISKNDLIDNFDDFIIPPIKDNAYRIQTSGTTGQALSLLKTPRDTSIQWAVWLRHRSRFGVSLGDMSVNFTGKRVVPIKQKAPPFWRYNRFQNQYLVNMQHINATNIESIVEFLNSVNPVFYSGYPSIISEVARLALEANLKLNEKSRPRVIFCGGENLLSYQRRVIEDWAEAIITDQYGLTEGNCNFSKCEKGRYHEDYEFCHIEIVDGFKNEADGFITGRLIGTGYYNEVHPLIRYDTGDIATMMPEDFKCECGRKSRVFKSVEGRVDDFVVTPEGQRIMRFDYLFKDTIEVSAVQVIQRRKGEVVLASVMKDRDKKQAYEAKLRKRVAEWISEEIEVAFEYPQEIEKTKAGKFKAVVNMIVDEVDQ